MDISQWIQQNLTLENVSSVIIILAAIYASLKVIAGRIRGPKLTIKPIIGETQVRRLTDDNYSWEFSRELSFEVTNQRQQTLANCRAEAYARWYGLIFLRRLSWYDEQGITSLKADIGYGSRYAVKPIRFVVRCTTDKRVHVFVSFETHEFEEGRIERELIPTPEIKETTLTSLDKTSSFKVPLSDRDPNQIWLWYTPLTIEITPEKGRKVKRRFSWFATIEKNADGILWRKEPIYFMVRDKNENGDVLAER